MIHLVTGIACLVPAVVPLGEITARCGLGVAMGLGLTLGWHLRWYRRVGGLTGDIVGAAVEIREVAMLAAMATALPPLPW
ncbi:MAG: adenosylcobinamide-GDP ribazoletransferase [Deltaproteobacteria bacterium]|nr:adenosylcobinamide-GDP ribazoletransferase [Deltaproteobacteria bacterium]